MNALFSFFRRGLSPKATKPPEVQKEPAPEERERADGLLRQGLVLRKEGTTRWDEAERCFREALQLDPRSARAHQCLGALLISRSNNSSENAPGPSKRLYNEALPMLERSVQIDGSLPGPHYEVARSDWTALGKAVEEYMTASRLDTSADPEYAVHHWSVAQRMSRSGRTDLALEAFRRAIRCDPGYWGGYVKPSREPALSIWAEARRREGLT